MQSRESGRSSLELWKLNEDHPTLAYGNRCPGQASRAGDWLGTNFENAGREDIGFSLGVNKGFPYF